MAECGQGHGPTVPHAVALQVQQQRLEAGGLPQRSQGLGSGVPHLIDLEVQREDPQCGRFFQCC